MANVKGLSKVPKPGSAGHTAVAAAPASPAGHAEQVKYNITPLGQAALKHREATNNWRMCNVAVVAYTVPGQKDPVMVPMESRDKAHSDRRLVDELKRRGIPLDRVVGLYTEREPCSEPGSHCKSMLAKELPGVPVSYSFEFGESEESQKRGNAALAAELSHYRPGTIGPVEDAGSVRDGVTPEERVAAAEQIQAVRAHFHDDARVSALIHGREEKMSDSQIEKEMRAADGTTHKQFLAARERLADYRRENP